MASQNGNVVKKKVGNTDSIRVKLFKACLKMLTMYGIAINFGSKYDWWMFEITWVFSFEVKSKIENLKMKVWFRGTIKWLLALLRDFIKFQFTSKQEND